MQNYPPPTPPRRQSSQGSSGQILAGSSSASPSPIRRAPPSYESVRQSPEKSGKVQKLL